MLADLAPTKRLATHAAPLLGRLVDGYQLVDVLGAGGMSIVYRGEQSGGIAGEHTPVAIKVMQLLPVSQPASRARFLARFRREVQVAMSLCHPHIVPMLGSGAIDGQPYVVFPLLAGGTLAARLAQRHEPLSLEEAGRYARQVADALDYAHAHGVVHRDVKLSNVLLDDHGNAYLADFGIARLFEGGVEALEQPDGTDVTTLTTTGEIIGTPSYMAPEQFQGQTVGPAADVYALGVVLYQLVTGRLPFTGETAVAVGLHHLHDAPLSPRILRPDLPVPGAAAILRALAKMPEQRFVSAGELAYAFASGLQGRWVGQHPEQEDTFYPSMTVAAYAASSVVSPTTTTATQPVRPIAGSRPRPAAVARPAPSNRRLAGVSGALLLLGALMLALHALYPGAGTAAQRAPGNIGTAIATSTSAPTHAPAAATHFRYTGARIYGLDNAGLSVWNTAVDAQVTRLTVAAGQVYAYTASGATYILRASSGQILTRQAPQPTAAPKKDGGDGKHGKGGGGGGGDNGG